MPWIWIMALLIAVSILFWMLLSVANQPEPVDVRGVGVQRDVGPRTTPSLSI